MRLLNFFKASPVIPTKDYEENEFKSVRLKNFFAFSFAYAIYYVARLSFSVAKGPMLDEGVVSATELGIIGTGIYITYAVGKFINSALADHAHLTRFFSMGLLLSALCNLLMGFNTSAIAFTIIWTFNGWFQSMGVGPCVVELSRWYEEKERGSYYGFWSVAHNLGEWLSFSVTGLVVSWYGWRSGFNFAAAAAIIGALVAFKWMKDSPQSLGYKEIIHISKKNNTDELDQKEVLKHQWEVVKNPAIWMLAIGCCCIYVGRYAINSWGVLFLQKEKLFDISTAAMLIGSCTFVGILGTASSGWISDKFLGGRRNVMTVVVCCINTAALAAFLFAPKQNILISAISLCIFAISLGISLAFLGGLLATDISHKSSSGIALGMMGVFGYGGAAASEILTGIILDHNKIIVNGVATYNFNKISWFWVYAGIASIITTVLFAILAPKFNRNADKKEL